MGLEDNLKENAKKLISASLKTVAILIAFTAIVLGLLSGSTYVVQKHRASYQEGEEDNVPYVVDENIESATIDSEGVVTLDKTAEELWDELVENNSHIDDYLDDAEALNALMKAELITNYLDTRENPDEEIDWDEILESDADSNVVQGIIKLKRETEDETTYTMTYVDSDTFQSYIDEYNSTGSETAKEEALKHFTLSREGVMAWPTEASETTISSEFGTREAPNEDASDYHEGIDIAISEGTDVYATEAGTVTFAGEGDEEGYYIIIDHGNGYDSMYLHCSELLVSEGDVVEKGDLIAYSGNTGNSTGPHLHFQINYEGEAVDPLSFLYDNGMGEGTTGIGSDSSTDNTYYAVVATWTKTTETVVSDDPDVADEETGDYPKYTYTMTTTKIDYQSMVSGYTMPFDYLWAWLVYGGSQDFVLEVADLVYGSEIEITVHDNLTTTTTVSTETYTEMTKVITHDVVINVEYSDTETRYDNWDTKHEYGYDVTITGSATEGPFEDEGEEEVTYTTVTTIITEKNTLDVSLTKADVWIVTYIQDYYPENTTTTTTSDGTYEDEEYPEEPDETDNNDTMGFAEKFRQEVEAEYQAAHDSASASISSLITDYYYKTVNRTIHVETTTEKKIYTASPANITEKYDFVEIYLSYKGVQDNIESGGDEWLFEVLEENDKTKDMVDITKYLLYIATGDSSYYEGDFDFDYEYDPENFTSVTEIYGDTIQEKVWWALIDAGMDEKHAAACMGNFEYESEGDWNTRHRRRC